MSVGLADLFQMLLLPPGRRLHAQRRVAEVARAAKWKELADHCENAVEHEKSVLVMMRDVARVSKVPTSPELTALDPQIDRLVGAIYRNADEAATSLSDTAVGAHGRHLRERAYPAGVFPIVSKSYVEQCVEVESLIALLEGELSAAVQGLHLETYVAELKRLNTLFRGHLDAAPRAEATQDLVRGANSVGQNNILTTMALVLGRFARETPTDVEGRTRFLEPIMVQHAAVHAYHKIRRRVRDVDPDTGTELPVAEQTSGTGVS